jgi:hypothetical protein
MAKNPDYFVILYNYEIKEFFEMDMRAFEQEPDIYTAVASALFEVKKEAVTEEQRTHVKRELFVYMYRGSTIAVNKLPK